MRAFIKLFAAVVLLGSLANLQAQRLDDDHKKPANLFAWHGPLTIGNPSNISLEALEKRRVQLPNGWSLTPVGFNIPLGDLPLNIAVSRTKKYLAVTNNGQSDQSVLLINPAKQIVLDSMPMSKSWLGLAFSDDERSLYAVGGYNNWVLKFDIVNNKLVPTDTFALGKPWPEKISPAGLAVDEKRNLLYVVTKDDNSLYVIDTKLKQTRHKLPLGDAGYTCLLSPDKNLLYITCWGCSRVLIYNTNLNQFSGSVAVGSNPNDMCLSRDGLWLYVANSNDNTVSVIDIARNKVAETLNAALYPDAPNGSTTNGVALSEDSKILYVANADNNCLAVFDVSKPGESKSKGFIPTGWYPTCVRVINKYVFVANGKGYGSLPNPGGPKPVKNSLKIAYQQGDNQKPKKVDYIAGLFRGAMTVLPEPDDKQLGIYSQVVYHNTPYNKDRESYIKTEDGNPIPSRVGDVSPIKYVFYIIKENRTYDQVLSDVPGGNGDTSLLFFGEKVTPNEHAIVKNFVLYDNFYVDGEVSADGHNWSTAAYATDYLEKTWPTAYGGRGGDYDAEGNREIASSKNGFIWNLCKKYGVTYRTYGEFADDYKPNIPVLKDHFCPFYTSWDQSVRDTTRFHQWQRDFDSLLAIGKVPHFNSLRFINDHTRGLRSGELSPSADVADNDLATGMFIDYLSHSKIWNEAVVFVVEDDAQAGSDHVDAHRSTLYVAGGYVKRQYVDHTMYSTSSVLRTMELILGLPPMSQYDAAAVPLWRSFNHQPDSSAFTHLAPTFDLDNKNTAMNQWQRMSDGFDFKAEDRVPDALFNQVLWAAMKGDNKPCPAPVHAAFVRVRPGDKD